MHIYIPICLSIYLSILIYMPHRIIEQLHTVEEHLKIPQMDQAQVCNPTLRVAVECF